MGDTAAARFYAYAEIRARMLQLAQLSTLTALARVDRATLQQAAVMLYG